ncbi:hypothetical protein DID77_03360 [Candidatus Marinamargulisbacteria bacterium SCGC AG-439-L15]|nr:hypothetical protein DID77_03360 [Candidatus Marinamargulisbacteria bacterium SCGC AG-439-L15]
MYLEQLKKIVSCNQEAVLFESKTVSDAIKTYRNECKAIFSKWASFIDVLKDANITTIKFKNCFTGEGVVVTPSNCETVLPALHGSFILDVNISKGENSGVLRVCDALRSARLSIDGRSKTVKVVSLALPRTVELSLSLDEIETNFSAISCSKKVDGSLGVLTVTKEGLALINTKRTARGDHAALVRNCLESAGAITDQLTAPELKPGTYVFELLSKEYNPFAIQEQSKDPKLVFLTAWDEDNEPIDYGSIPWERDVINQNEVYTSVEELNLAVEILDEGYEGLVVWGVDKEAQVWCFKLKNKKWKEAHQKKNAELSHGDISGWSAQFNEKYDEKQVFKDLLAALEGEKKSLMTAINAIEVRETNNPEPIEGYALLSDVSTLLKGGGNAENTPTLEIVSRKTSKKKKDESLNPLEEKLNSFLTFLARLRLGSSTDEAGINKKKLEDIWKATFRQSYLTHKQLMQIVDWVKAHYPEIEGLPDKEAVKDLVEKALSDDGKSISKVRNFVLHLFALSVNVMNLETKFTPIKGSVHFMGDPTSTDIDCVFLTEKAPLNEKGVEKIVHDYISKVKTELDSQEADPTEVTIEDQNLRKLLCGFPDKKLDITTVVLGRDNLKVMKDGKETEAQPILSTLRHTAKLYTSSSSEDLSELRKYSSDPNTSLTVKLKSQDIFKRFYDLESDQFESYHPEAKTIFKFLKRLPDPSFLKLLNSIDLSKAGSSKDEKLIGHCLSSNSGKIRLNREVQTFLAAHHLLEATEKLLETLVDALNLNVPELTPEVDNDLRVLIFKLRTSILKDILSKITTDQRSSQQNSLDIFVKNSSDNSAGFLKSFALKALQALAFDYLKVRSLDDEIGNKLYIKQALLDYLLEEGLVPTGDVYNGLEKMLKRHSLQKYPAASREICEAVNWIEEEVMTLWNQVSTSVVVDANSLTTNLVGEKLSGEDIGVSTDVPTERLEALGVIPEIANLDEHDAKAMIVSQLYAPFAIASDLLLSINGTLFPIEIKCCRSSSAREIERENKSAYTQLRRAARITGAKRGLVIIYERSRKKLRFFSHQLNPFAKFAGKRSILTNKTPLTELELGNEIESLLIKKLGAALKEGGESVDPLLTDIKQQLGLFIELAYDSLVSTDEQREPASTEGRSGSNPQPPSLLKLGLLLKEPDKSKCLNETQQRELDEILACLAGIPEGIQQRYAQLFPKLLKGYFNNPFAQKSELMDYFRFLATVPLGT